MILEASRFKFKAPAVISRARRVLIKPSAGLAAPYPVTTSHELLAAVIRGIRKISDADILLLEGMPGSEPVYPVYQSLGYNFPRVLTLDVSDSIWVEVDNPLPKPFAVPTFWVPNVILSSDYLISIAPLKVIDGYGYFTLMNLLPVLPSSKYQGDSSEGWSALYNLGIDKVIADLYFTLPFDLGIIEGRQLFTGNSDNPTEGDITTCNQIFIGEPYEIDCEAAQMMGLKPGYLELIKSAKIGNSLLKER